MPRPSRDLTDQQFGRLIARSRVSTSGRARWNCQCDCGKPIVRKAEDLLAGNTTSCGCWGLEKLRERSTTHGQSPKGNWTKAYRAWVNMHQRCFNPKVDHYPQYGGRGITVCERWMKFENFVADMGEPEPKLTLDRKETNGNYEPDNCRWATQKVQQSNRRNNKIVTLHGERITVTEAERRIGISRQTITRRIIRGQDIVTGMAL